MPTISGDGRFIAFTSMATNLVRNDKNDKTDVFLHDNTTGITMLVSTPNGGGQSNGTSGYVDCTGSGCVEGLDISADGRFVAFASSASNLVAGDSNDSIDVFVYDRATSHITSVTPDGDGNSGQPSISNDGRLIVFTSFATTLTPMPDDIRRSLPGPNVFVRDLQTGSTQLISYEPTDDRYALNWSGENPSISGDGRYIAFTSDVDYIRNEEPGYDSDVFVYAMSTGDFERVSVSDSGAEAERGTSFWVPPVLSETGRFVAFRSHSPLVVGDTNDEDDVFVHDRVTSITSRASVGAGGVEANRGAMPDTVGGDHSISGDGQSIAFDSYSTNLVPNDMNEATDVFVRSSVLDQEPILPADGRMDYLAMGDSYSAGEGVDPYFSKGRCHQSKKAYSTFVRPTGYSKTLFELDDDAERDVSWEFLACSGATTANILPEGLGGHPQEGRYGQELTQIDRGENGSAVDLITITVGGNDVRFSDVLKFCALKPCMSDKTFRDGRSLAEWLPVEIDYTRHKLVNTYQSIKDANPNATVAVLSYPMLFPDSQQERTCRSLAPWTHEQEFLREAQIELHGVIESAAAEVGVNYIDVAPHFAGHEICGNGGEWINGPSAADLKCRFKGIKPTCNWFVDDESFHPDKRGQREYAAVLNQWLADSGPALPGNPPPQVSAAR